MPTKVAIIGGGFGGIYTLLQLQKKIKDVEVYLFNKDSDFVFTPLLHEAATGGVNTDNIVVPIRSFIKSCNVKFIKSIVTQVDLEKKVLLAKCGQFDFDYLVIATGSVSNTHDIEGVDQHCLFLKTVDDALGIKRKIISNLEEYCITKEESLLSFTVIGGGPTGVELAFEIDEYISTTLTKNFYDPSISQNLVVNLVCSSQRILSSMPKNMQAEAEKRLKKSKINFLSNSYVDRVTKGSVFLNSNVVLKSSTVIWCAGVRPNVPDSPNFAFLDNINSDLSVGSYNNVFVLGDCANYRTSIPMDAQAAVKQAAFVVNKIINLIIGKSDNSVFSYKPTGQLISLGRWKAAGNISGIPIKGFIAWWIWRTVYLIRFPLASKRIKIMIDWTVSIFSQRDMSNI